MDTGGGHGVGTSKRGTGPADKVHVDLSPGAVARHDLSPSELQAHVEKWYRWSNELARQGRGNAGTALGNPGAAVRGHERVVTDCPQSESMGTLVTGGLIFEAASLEDAIHVARTCPTYEFGGSVEVLAGPGPPGSEAGGTMKCPPRMSFTGSWSRTRPEGVRAPGQRADPGPGRLGIFSSPRTSSTTLWSVPCTPGASVCRRTRRRG